MENQPTRTVTVAIRNKIRRLRRGEPFTTAEVRGCGQRAAVDQALSRLAREGLIMRLARGIYVKPKVSPVLGPLTVPAAAVAQAVARSQGGAVHITGAEAANRLGLSTQVPAQTLYLTDGPSRTIWLGRQKLKLIHRSPRALIGAGTTAGVVISALRYLGKSAVTEQVVTTLKHSLGADTKTELRSLIALAPVWLEKCLVAIAGE